MANKIVKYQLANGTIPTWTEDANDPNNPDATVPFDQAQAASYIWSKKID